MSLVRYPQWPAVGTLIANVCMYVCMCVSYSKAQVYTYAYTNALVVMPSIVYSLILYTTAH